MSEVTCDNCGRGPGLASVRRCHKCADIEVADGRNDGPDMVLGFFFTQSFGMVALIKKLRPDWQKGLLNGIGGKVKDGEKPLDAMAREFKEEAGASVTDWEKFGELVLRNGRIVHLYYAAAKGVELESKTDEEVGWYKVGEVLDRAHDQVPNLHWLLGVAMDQDEVKIRVQY